MPRPAPSVSRVVSLLNLLGEHPGEFLTLSDVARRLSLNKATAHGILTALTEAEFVVRQADDKGYSLGPAIVRVGRTALRREYEIASLARHEMETLADEANGQAVAIAADGDQIIVIATAGAPAGTPGTYVGHRGRRLPPMGMVFIAWAAEEEIDRWLSPEPLTDEEREHYRELLNEVRSRGFSTSMLDDQRPRIEEAINQLLHEVDNQEIKESLVGLMAELAREATELSEIQTDRHYRLRQITAPIFDEDGIVRLGLALTGLPEVTGEQVRDFGYALSAAASRISRRIGGHPPSNTSMAIVAAPIDG
jgi:DNA-binding IclR family transcriptional regulator